MSFPAATTTWDTDYTPAVTLTRDTDGALTAVLGVSGLEALRTPTAEETAAGVSSLDPVTVYVADGGDRPAATRRLVQACWRGLAAATASTLGRDLQPAELSSLYARTSIAVRGALRAIEEDA